MTPSARTVPERELPGGMIALAMFLLGVAIAFPQVPIWLALGIGAVIPPVAYLCYVFNKSGHRAGDYTPADITIMFAGNSGSVALGLAVRLWREYAIIDHRPFGFTCLGIAAVLALVVHFTRGASSFSHFRFILFAVYLAVCLAWRIPTSTAPRRATCKAT